MFSFFSGHSVQSKQLQPPEIWKQTNVLNLIIFRNVVLHLYSHIISYHKHMCKAPWAELQRRCE